MNSALSFLCEVSTFVMITLSPVCEVACYFSLITEMLGQLLTVLSGLQLFVLEASSTDPHGFLLQAPKSALCGVGGGVGGGERGTCSDQSVLLRTGSLYFVNIC